MAIRTKTYRTYKHCIEVNAHFAAEDYLRASLAGNLAGTDAPDLKNYEEALDYARAQIAEEYAYISKDAHPNLNRTVLARMELQAAGIIATEARLYATGLMQTHLETPVGAASIKYWAPVA
jgi:hypothetical protein